MKNPNYYTLAEEILEDLNNMFGDYDKISKADAELDNSKFAIGSKDFKETFDAFHARFIAAIAPLAMLEREKSSRLRKLVTSRLKYRIVDFPITTSFRELVTRLRQVDIALRLTDKQNPRGNRSEGSSSSSNNRGDRGGSNTRGRGGSNNNNSRQGNPSRSSRNDYRHPLYIKDRLDKEGRYYKYLRKGYISYDPDTPCRNKLYLDEKQVNTRLVEISIEVVIDPPPTYSE